MKKMNVKPATIARIGALLVALANQCLILFGRDILPFTENMAYQVVSLAVTFIIVAINAWCNNDITKVAILSGKVLDALKDGKITEQEIENMLVASENADADEEIISENIFVKLINKMILAIKTPKNKE